MHERANDGTRRTSALRAAVVLLLAAHLALLLDGARRDSVTFDELVFVTGGLSHWRTGDFRLSPDGGALPQRLQALPLVLAGVRLPEDAAAWARSDAWALGHRLFYESGHDPARLIFLARLPVALLSVLLAWLVHVIARRIFGDEAALISLALYAFSPAFLAHGRLATADLVFTLALTASAWLCSLCLQRVTRARLLGSLGAVAAAFIAKMSAILLVPMLALVALARIAAGAPMAWAWGRERLAETLPRRLAFVLGIVALHAAAAFVVVWLAFGLRYAAFRDPEPGAALKEGGWEAVAGAGAIDGPVAFAREHHVLPEAWLFGFQYSVKHSHERRAFAMNRWSMTGWRWFFPLVVILKTPLSALALILAAPVALALSWRAGRRATTGPRAREGLPAWAEDLLALAPLLAILLVYWPIALRTPLNIGLRHVLPTLPATFVLAGAAWSLGAAWKPLRAAVALLLGLAVLEGLAAHPLHLAYMNPLAGPPERRWTRFTDSSLDWGQDARRLAAFLRDDALHGDGAPAYVAWFGSSDPAGEGVQARFLPGFLDQRRDAHPEPLFGGTYCISATVLVQVFSNFPGPWAAPYEELWRRADVLARPYLDADDAERAQLRAAKGDAYWDRLLASHEQLRLARLCSYLRHRRPDATVGGGSVLVFRLTDADVARALRSEPQELVPEPLLPWAGSQRLSP